MMKTEHQAANIRVMEAMAKEKRDLAADLLSAFARQKMTTLTY